jgi:hypothetical protein
MANESDCPICLDPILTNEFNEIEECIILECCNKQVHLSCLIDWSKSEKNTNKNACVLCRQETDFLRDFHNNIQTQDTLIDIPLDPRTTSMSDTNITYTNLTYHNQPQDIFCLSCLLSTICGGILYLILVD